MNLIEKFLNLIGLEKVKEEKTLEARKGRPAIWRWRRRRTEPQPVPKPKNDNPIDYLMNDMTTPNLVKSVPLSQTPIVPKVVIRDYKGGGFARDSAEASAANCFVTISNTLNFYRKFTGRDGIKPLLKWAGANSLMVIPRAGIDLNAFYNRRSMQFFYFLDPSVSRIVATADSSDIVAHELGHGILDSFRPDTWSAASLEVWSLHEAFADLTSILHVMIYDEVLQHALNENGGDMRKPSVISRVAEDVGRAIYTLVEDKGGRHPAQLRSAINDFKYVNPSLLPEEAPHDKLAAECHSFGRVFLGAFYDFLVAVYEDTTSQGVAQIDALRHARDVVGQYAIRAIQNAPLNAKFYLSMAKTLIWVANNTDGGRYKNQMQKVLIDRCLISPEVKALGVAPRARRGETIVKVQSKVNVKLADMIPIRAMSDNPLYEVEVEVPMEEAYLYDNDRNVIDSVTITPEESYAAAQDFINYLHRTNSVDGTEITPFEVKDGKLVRTFID